MPFTGPRINTEQSSLTFRPCRAGSITAACLQQTFLTDGVIVNYSILQAAFYAFPSSSRPTSKSHRRSVPHIDFPTRQSKHHGVTLAVPATPLALNFESLNLERSNFTTYRWSRRTKKTRKSYSIGIKNMFQISESTTPMSYIKSAKQRLFLFFRQPHL